MASHGYVVIRPDMRGSGESGGLYFDEYEKQEQDDACEIIDWLSKQPWSNGAVGMYGKSWGGFNGLQVAFLQPPALKGVITLYSTDNRFTDDVHYKGGCIANIQALNWANFMTTNNSKPPHPELYCSPETWKADWLRRLDVAGVPCSKKWFENQVRQVIL